MGSLADLCASEVIVEKIDKAYEDGYNKAIEEFAEEILKKSQTANRSPFNNDYTVLIHKSVIEEIASELKGE